MHEMARKQVVLLGSIFFLDPPYAVRVNHEAAILVGVGFHPGDQPF